MQTVLIIQRLVAQRRRIVIGNGLAAPAAQHFLQKNGGSRGGRALGHDREVRLGDIVPPNVEAFRRNWMTRSF